MILSKKTKKWLASALVVTLGINFAASMGPVYAETPGYAEDLIISEYLEGSSNNKAIELYNGTGETIDLSQYKLELYSNGSSKASNPLQLSGELEHGKNYIVANEKANADILAVANETATVTYFNGDDALVLKKNDEVIDSFGQVGVDPGTAWVSPDGSVSTLDMTLVRKSTILSGDTIIDDEFDPSVEWIAYPKDTTTYLGNHEMDTADVVVIPVTEVVVEGTMALEAGAEETISVGYVPENTTEKGVTFVSDKEEVATVSNEGVVTGIKEGTATITVTSTKNEAVSKTVAVTVTKAADKKGPTFESVEPKESSSVGSEKRPTITVHLEDETGIDFDTVEMMVDGETVQPTVEGNKVTYKMTKDLASGAHKVVVKVADTLGNVSIKEWTFYVGETTKNLYFGQLHSHTNLSDGQGTLDEAYTYARDKAEVDFLAITDHSNWFDNDTKANIADGSASEEWKEGQAAANKYNEKDNFVAMYAYEMSWSGSTGGYGHMNTFNTPGFETRTNLKMDLKTYYNTLKTQPQSISMFNHPGTTFGDFVDFGYYDEEIDKLVTLIEVGNGEGAVGSNGYWPSYDYYDRALSKGWHVAPTNGQDNHKGKWGDSNTTRTVIEAPELTRDALYEAMRQRRVYSTEDENLRISYEVNGHTMGSILEDTETLNVKINIEDPDATDKISKIQLIGDGGVVVKELSNVNAQSKAWNFSMPSNYSYYYVKVVQADGQIAVTAPVWVGESFNAGVEAVKSNETLVFPNEEITLETTLYNNTGVALENVKVEYFLNNETTKLGEKVIAELKESVKDTFTFTSETAGKKTIIAKMTVMVNGVEHIFMNKTDILVKNEYEVSKVVLDASHQNYYVSGDYKGNMKAFKNFVEESGGRLHTETKEITKETLEGASLLVLTDPQSYASESYGLVPYVYSEAEIAVIKDFVEQGGNLVITSRADYKDEAGEYGNAHQSNIVLEAIGSTLRFNDDQVIDPVNNGGQAYRLYFDKYNESHSLLEGVNKDLTFSFYSGNSVLLTDEKANAQALVYSHSTTTNSDADNQGDYTPVEPGKIVPLAAETLENGATIIAGGTTFFSDFETNGESADKYTNATIMKNILKQLAPEPELPVTAIKDVRVDANGDNVPDKMGETFVIEGTVTSASSAASDKNAFFDVIYVQDETAGITVFGVSQLDIKVGQKVRVKGYVDEYAGDTELAVSNEFTAVTIIDETIQPLDATKLSTLDSMKEENEGLLVQTVGTVTRMDEQNVYINDGTGEARAYVEGYIGSSSGKTGQWNDGIQVGDTVSVIGLASEDPEGERLRVRDTDEVVKVTAPTPVPPTEDDEDEETVPPTEDGEDEETVPPTEDGESEETVPPTEDDETTQPDVDQPSTDKEETETPESENPETGDNMNVMLMIGVFLFAVGAVFGLRKKVRA